jgi:N-acetylglucosaminyldiphosphoundecaprenol N-acetyl-beta-D-mannosaminyltransferase
MREINIFDIKFIDANVDEIYHEIEKGGFMIAPSAPSLTLLELDENYRASMKNSNFAIFDSSLLCLLLLLTKGIKVQKISGLKFLKFFLEKIKHYENDSIFLIDPTLRDMQKNRMLINSHKYQLQKSHQYIAPIYNKSPIIDIELLKLLEKLKPKWILINLGGGVQEMLADYIKSNISFKASILCTGAAIAFITGEQAKIPTIIDRMYLGWLMRCLVDGKKFIPRYIKGLKIVFMLIRTQVKIK